MSIDSTFIKNWLQEHPEEPPTEQQNGHKSLSSNKSSKKVWTVERQNAFLEKYKDVLKPGARHDAKDEGGTECEITCPFCGNKASVHLTKDGRSDFQCFHESQGCNKKHWHDFHDHFEPRLDSYYEYTEDGMVYHKLESSYNAETKERDYYFTPITLSNFAAAITADVQTDDGAECMRSYSVRAELLGRTRQFDVPAKEFANCDWVDEHLGARALITVGRSMKAHLVNAVKECSEPVEQVHYAHTGWREIDGRMTYLHTGGGVVSRFSRVEKNNNKYSTNLTDLLNAPVECSDETLSRFSRFSRVLQEGVASVKLTGALEQYTLPDPVPQDETVQATRASMRFLDLAPETVTVPLYAACWRAPLGSVDFGVHITGESGLGKTELVALIQQFYGARMDSHHLPGGWESTENSLELLLFQAKDAVLVIDDFKPKGGKGSQEQWHMKADRIFRQIGNGSARGRLTSNLEQRAQRPPRCLPISTGEDTPHGQSVQARGVMVMLTEKITEGVRAKRLTEAQKDARAGRYAQVMAAYLEWLSPRIVLIQQHLPDLIAAERDRLSLEGHARASTNTANLLLGMRIFLHFAESIGAITAEEANMYLERCTTALLQVAGDAAQSNRQATPSEQYKRLLASAIAAKKAHLALPNGYCPGLEYGWEQSLKQVSKDGIECVEETLHGCGAQIGWVDGDDLYLDPVPAYIAARAMGSASGDEITIQEVTLRKMLLKDKVLASNGLETPRKMITVRRTLQNVQRSVLHLKTSLIFPSSPDNDTPPPSDAPSDSEEMDRSEDAQYPTPNLDSLSYEKSTKSTSLTNDPPESALEADLLSEKISRVEPFSRVPESTNSQNGSYSPGGGQLVTTPGGQGHRTGNVQETDYGTRYGVLIDGKETWWPKSSIVEVRS